MRLIRFRGLFILFYILLFIFMGFFALMFKASFPSYFEETVVETEESKGPTPEIVSVSATVNGTHYIGETLGGSDFT